jgi:uncharacterized protein (TIGR03000 family)
MFSVMLMATMATAPETPSALLHRSSGCDSGCASHGHRHARASGGSCGHARGGCGHATAGCGGCGHAAVGCGGCGPAMAGCGGCGYAMMAPATTGVMVAVAPAAAPATLRITGAGDATVTVNGYVTTSRGDSRVLVTPDLPAGEVYHYDLTAEMVRDGQRVTLTQAVTVRAGATAEVRLDFAANAVVMK